MSDRFNALLITKESDKQTVNDIELTLDDLMEGDVTIAVSHSTVNYKDGLAITGRSPVVRRFPMIPGVDLAGTVAQSASPAFHEGERVLVNGFGLGETHYGGYAGYARLKSEWVLRVPEAFSCADVMAIGTAGYTAMLAVMALEDAGITPEKGPILVTGAVGGIGSVAVALLAKLGYRVIASTGREEEGAYLSSLGAQEIIPRNELQSEPRPLARERWAGAIDNVGSRILANVLSATAKGGAVAACGLAQGIDLPTSVAPFILRGVSLLGIESVHMHMPRRQQAWGRLARDLDPQTLAAITRTIGFHELRQAAEDIMAGRVRGRLVVDIAA